VGVKYVLFEWVRVGTDGCFYVSEDWTDKTIAIKKYFGKDSDERMFMYQFKVSPMQIQYGGRGRKLSFNYYPQVPYSGAVKSIMTDVEIANYQLSEIVNNFSLGTILSLNNGNPDEQDKKLIEREIMDYATGSDNAGGVYITYANGKDTEPTVVHLNGNQLHERYLALSKDVRDNIMKGHGVVSGELFGFEQTGSFNAETLDFAYWLMKENYFKVRQKQLLEAVHYVDGGNAIQFKEVSLPTTTTQPTAAPVAQFSAQDQTNEVLSRFEKCGIDRNGVEILMSEPFSDEPFKDFINGAAKFVSAIELQVLNLISDGNTFDKISKALNINPSDLAKIYKRLERGGHTDNKGSVTRQGRLTIVQNDVTKMKIVYSYEVKPNYGDKIIDGTRDFCRALIDMNRLYTREEIDGISNDLDMDVWRYRGGYYHNPKTGKNEPACRHFWKSNLIFNG
jgi:hypothetical protein